MAVVRDASGIVRGRVFAFKRGEDTILKAQAYGRFAALYSGPEWEKTHWSDVDLMAGDLSRAINGNHASLQTCVFVQHVASLPTAEYRPAHYVPEAE